MLTYSQLWAKTGSANLWHALPFHLLDVAAAAEAVWDRLPRNATAVATEAVGNDRRAKRICVFLAGTHDIGKANRFFQAKAHTQHSRLCELGANLPPYSLDDKPRHGQATGAYLKPWLNERWLPRPWRSQSAVTMERFSRTRREPRWELTASHGVALAPHCWTRWRRCCWTATRQPNRSL